MFYGFYAIVIMNKAFQKAAILAEDDELLLLSALPQSKLHVQKDQKFDLEKFSPEECKLKFRFEKHDICRLQ